MVNVIFDIAAALADCICKELKRKRPESAHPEADGWTGDCCVHPGSVVAYERCCDKKQGAQAWVVALDGVPTVSFPIPDPEGAARCDDGHTYIQRYEIGALRCVAWGGDDGASPKCETKEQDALNVLGDLVALQRALECCFDDEGPRVTICSDRNWRLQEYHLVGPEGGCAGAVITIVVEIPAPCCLPPEEVPA